MKPMEDSSEKRLLGMTVWKIVRAIISKVVVTTPAVSTAPTAPEKTVLNNSGLSYWATEDVARIAEYIRNSDMQLLFQEVIKVTQEKELALLGKASKMWETDPNPTSKLKQTIEDIKKRTDLNIQPHHFRTPNPKHFIPTRRTVHPIECFRATHSYMESYQATCLYLAIKITAETSEYCTEKQMREHGHWAQNLLFSKS